MFHIGQKVVAIQGQEPKPNLGKRISGKINVGEIYTVRDIEPVYLEFQGMVGIRVHEYHAPKYLFRGVLFEPATLACHFRPLIERKTDISVFTALLNPANHKKLEDA